MFIVNEMPRSVSAEAYRVLRTKIQYSSVDTHIKTIVITSSMGDEGKSTVAGNLAFVLSQNESKVLLIDCDLRKPSLHKKFSIENEMGLTDLLIKQIDFKNAVNKISDNLSVITAGTLPPNPAEILASNTLQDFIKSISEKFNYIILDTPPILLVTDAQVLAAKADSTILVVRAKKTKKRVILQSYKELEKVKANVIGSVLNDSDINGEKSYYHYGEKGKKKLLNIKRIRL